MHLTKIFNPGMAYTPKSLGVYHLKNTQPNFKNYISWLFVHIWRHKILFILNLIGIILVTYTRTIIPVRIGEIIDSIIIMDFSNNLLQIIIILFGMYLLRNLTEYVVWMIGHKLGSKTEQSMRREFFENVQRKPLRFHDQIKTGDLQALATNDLRVVNTMIAHGSFYLYPFIQSAVTLILQLQNFTIEIAGITFPILAAYLYFVLQYRKKLLPYSKQALSKHADITVSLQESLNGIPVTRAFCAEDVEKRKFKSCVQAYRENWLGENRVQAKFYPLLILYLAMGSTYIAGIFFIKNNQMTIGQITAVSLLLFTLIQPTQMIFWATKDMIGGFGASERLFAIISTDDVEPLATDQSNSDFRFNGGIEFKNVSFAYPNGLEKSPTVLKNINFKIHPNQRIALVGPTGCGKSTLAKLLLRLYQPCSGSIFIDNKDIESYPLQQVRQQIGLIEQDIFLFSQSISENIKFGNPDATNDEVLQVAQLAHVHDFVSSFPQEYETIVGERGTRLSGGEKQRIAIARAFLTNPDILILDDSMSAIDSKTEEKIGKAIKNILRNRTTLIITHRLHTIRTSDLILVMKQGQIIAQGKHDDLLKTSPDYRKIFGKQLQFKNTSTIKGDA